MFAPKMKKKIMKSVVHYSLGMRKKNTKLLTSKGHNSKIMSGQQILIAPLFLNS